MASTSAKFAQIDAEYGDRVKTMTEEEKMLAGLPYLALEPHLTVERLRARHLYLAYNRTAPAPLPEAADAAAVAAPPSNPEIMSDERKHLLSQLLRVPLDKLASVEIEPPFYLDYGSNIHLKGAFYANSNATILDCAAVNIGDGVLFGPNVHIYCATHSTSVKERKLGLERALPVTIGDDTWIGGNTTIMAGVTIGKGCTVGAGSTVTRDIPDWSVAVGAPARVVKTVPEEERGL
ncbi:hypothetical protein ACQY0O_008095 [Thecaphora frezii]